METLLHCQINTIVFASEGPPNDAGVTLNKKDLQQLECWFNEGGASSFKLWTPRLIEEDDDKWCVQQFPPEHRMPANRGYSDVGLGAWKAVIIRKTLETCRDGDIVVYRDCNVKRYPCIKLFAQNVKQYVLNVTQLTDFFMPPQATVGEYCGVEVLNFLIDSQDTREVIAQAPMCRANIIIVKATPRTRAFIALFERTMKENPWLLSPVGKTGFPGCNFKRQTAEQAVLNVLAYREGMIPLKWQHTTSWVERFRHAGDEPGGGVKAICGLSVECALEDDCVETTLGEPFRKEWKYAIVIQGPYHPEWTVNTIKIFIERNTDDDTLLIVSTYAPEAEVKGDVLLGTFLSDFERTQLNEGGRLVYIFVKVPSVERYPTFWRTNFRNQNLQRLSSFVGLRYAQQLGIEKSLKVRSDVILGRPNVCSYLNELLINKRKIVVCNKTGRVYLNFGGRLNVHKTQMKDGAHFVYDKFYFGDTEDLLKFFDIRAGCSWDCGAGIEVGGKGAVETCLTRCWMRNIGLNPDECDLEYLLKHHLAVAHTLEVEYVWQKQEDYRGYLTRNGKEALKREYAKQCRFFKYL